MGTRPLRLHILSKTYAACLFVQIVDMFAAATYLAGALEPWVALIVFVTIGSYIPLTIIVTEWRGNFRREMNRTENARSARVTDALLNCAYVQKGGAESMTGTGQIVLPWSFSSMGKCRAVAAFIRPFIPCLLC